MGLQSSRIIWGQVKEEDAKIAVALHDPSTIVYVKNNMVLIREADPEHIMHQITNLYVCEVEESQGEWDNVKDGWRSTQTIGSFEEEHEYQQGARCLYEGFLWSCTHDITNSDIIAHKNDDMLIPTSEIYWEKVYQTVAVAYRAMDHKEVFYDDGKNKNKWHKMMFYIPEEYDYKEDTEIVWFDPERQYHQGDRVLYDYNDHGIKCYEYTSNIPRRGEWLREYWEEVPEIQEYAANTAYKKGDQVFKMSIGVIKTLIISYQNSYQYNVGKHCIHEIDSREIDLGVSFPQEYRERILGGETIQGLYVATSDTREDDKFIRAHWKLIVNQELMIKGEVYNRDRNYIQQYEYGKSYAAGDIAIWIFEKDSDAFGLNICIKSIVSSTGENDPRNKEYWKTLEEILQMKGEYMVFKAKRTIPASDNTHWLSEDWDVATQKTEIDSGFYGVIWEKLGKPSGSGLPYAFPLFLSSATSGNTIRRDTTLSYFYPFLGDNCLEIERTYTGENYTPFVRYCYGFNTSIVAICQRRLDTSSLNRTYLCGLLIYNLNEFKYAEFDYADTEKWFEFVGENTIIYMEKLPSIDQRRRGKIYKSVFFNGEIAGRELIMTFDTEEVVTGYNVWYSVTYWNDNPAIECDGDSTVNADITTNNDIDPSAVKLIKHDVDRIVYDIDHNAYIYKQNLAFLTRSGDIKELDFYTRYTTNSQCPQGYLNGRLVDISFSDPDLSDAYDELNPNNPYFDSDWETIFEFKTEGLHRVSKKTGYLFTDRSDNLYSIGCKILSLYDPGENYGITYSGYSLFKWYLIKLEGGTYSETEIYSKLAHMVEDSEQSFTDAISMRLIGRENYDVYYSLYNAQSSTLKKYKVSLLTGEVTEVTLPNYIDLPYVGNQSFWVDDHKYSKARVLMNGNTAEDREVPENTYIIPMRATDVGYIDTYWVPYVTTAGGIAHCSDMLQTIGEAAGVEWAIYIPRFFHNPTGTGGFVWQYGYNYNYGPYYGGPENNGFINMGP